MRAAQADGGTAVAHGGRLHPLYYSNGYWLANNYLLKPEPDSKNDYGNGYGGHWILNATHTDQSNPAAVNPRTDWNGFYYDLCGPGSTTFIAHTWEPSAVSNYSNSYGDGENLSSNGVYGWGWGWYGFLYEAAYWEMKYSGGGVPWGTYWWKEKQFLNNNQASNYFIADPQDFGRSYLTEKNFKSDLDYDLHLHGGATMAAVDTAGLNNWSGAHVDHFLSVNGWNPGSSWVAYADTADQSYPGPTFGNFYEAESTFYVNAVRGPYSEQLVLT